MVLVPLPPERFVQVVMLPRSRHERARARAREDIDLDNVSVLEVYRGGFGPGIRSEGQRQREVAVCETEEADCSVEAPDCDDGPDEGVVFSFEDAGVACCLSVGVLVRQWQWQILTSRERPLRRRRVGCARVARSRRSSDAL